MKFKMTLDMTIEFEMPDGSTKDDAVTHFFEELSYVENGELTKAEYDVEECR